MSFRKTTALCSEIRTKCINTLCEQNVELHLVVDIVTTSLYCVLSLTGFIFFEYLISVNVLTYRLIIICADLPTDH